MSSWWKKIPRVRISLRAFFVMLSVLCLPLAWLGLEVRRAQVRGKAYVRLAELGVQLRYEHPGNRVDIKGRKLVFIPGERPLREIVFITGERPLPEIVYKWFGEHFMLRAKCVSTFDNSLSEETWENLSHFPELRGMEIVHSTKLDPSTLLHLQSFQKLEELSLRNTDLILTDANVKLFTELPNLKMLSPPYVRTDQAMRDKLKAELPDCLIQDLDGKNMWDHRMDLGRGVPVRKRRPMKLVLPPN